MADDAGVVSGGRGGGRGRGRGRAGGRGRGPGPVSSTDTPDAPPDAPPAASEDEERVSLTPVAPITPRGDADPPAGRPQPLTVDDVESAPRQAPPPESESTAPEAPPSEDPPAAPKPRDGAAVAPLPPAPVVAAPARPVPAIPRPVAKPAAPEPVALEEDEPTEELSYEEASAYALSQAVIDRREGVTALYPLTVRPMELGEEIGVGVGIYFDQLLLLLYAFLVLTFFAVVPAFFDMWVSWNVTPSLATIEQQESTDIGAQVSTDNAFYPTVTGTVRTVDRRNMTLAMAIVDVAASLGLFAYVYWLDKKRQDVAQEVDLNALTMSDYTIAVDGLPSDATEAEVCTHFENRAQWRVVDVVIAKAVSRYVAVRTTLVTANDELETAERRLAAAKSDARKAEHEASRSKIKAAYHAPSAEALALWARGFRTVRAFVTFDLAAAREDAERLYRAHWFQPRSLLFRGVHALRVDRAEEPSDVIWENLEYGPGARCCRSTLTVLATLLLLMASFVVVVFSKQATAYLPQEIDCAFATSSTVNGYPLLSCSAFNFGDSSTAGQAVRDLVLSESAAVGTSLNSDLACAYRYSTTYAAAPNTAYTDLSGAAFAYTAGFVTNCTARTCMSCYCRSQTIPVSTLANQLAGRASSDTLTNFCGTIWADETALYALQGGSVIIIAISSKIIEYAFAAFSYFEKHHSVTEKQSNLALKLSTALYFNVVVITIAVYTYVLDSRARQFYPILLNGPSWGYDFTTRWYSNVGTQLVLSLASNAVLYPFFTWLNTPVGWLLRRLLGPMARTQRQLNNALAGSDFTLDYRYGQLIAMFWICLTISAGIPLAIPVMVAYFFLTIRADKWELLRNAKRPAHLSSKLATLLARCLPWAIWVHLAFGFWMYGTLPSFSVPCPSSVPASYCTSASAGESDGGQFTIVDRIFKVNSLIFIVAFAALTIFLFLGNALWLLVLFFIECCRPREKGMLEQAREQLTADRAAAAGGPAPAAIPRATRAARIELKQDEDDVITFTEACLLADTADDRGLVGYQTYDLGGNDAYKDLFERDPHEARAAGVAMSTSALRALGHDGKPAPETLVQRRMPPSAHRRRAGQAKKRGATEAAVADLGDLRARAKAHHAQAAAATGKGSARLQDDEFLAIVRGHIAAAGGARAGTAIRVAPAADADSRV